MTLFALSQSIVFIAFVLGMFCFHLKSRRQLLVVLSISTALNATHFFLLGRPGPAILESIAASRQFLGAFYPLRKFLIIFLIAVVGGFSYSYTTPVSFLALLGSVHGTLATFQEDEFRLRAFFLVAGVFWTIHNFLAGTPVGFLMELAFLGSNFVGFLRFQKNARLKSF